MKPVAEEYLQLTELWNTAQKETIINNIVRYLGKKYPECEMFQEQCAKLAELTQSNRHTVYAWLNRSRDNVKIPLIKLCIVAEALNTDVIDFLKQ